MLKCRILLLLVFVLQGHPLAAQESVEMPTLLNFAHRGLSGIVPENTLLAIKMAIAYNADAVEMDIYRSSDSVLVLMHDKNLKRTAGIDVDSRPRKRHFRV